MTEEKKRRIRSFVRREGRITPSQREALTQYWQTYGFTTTDGLLDFTKVFGRQSEVVLEIGFGMGQSLLQMALDYPEKDYIGVEVHRPGVGALFVQLKQHPVNNLRVSQEDVTDVLRLNIPDASLSTVQIFFPDPWHKARHHKRRLIQADFINLVHQKLKPGGKFHLATDWQNYAEQMMSIISECKGFTNVEGEGNYLASSQQYRPTTKFEVRGRKLGHGVWDMIFVKSAN